MIDFNNKKDISTQGFKEIVSDDYIEMSNNELCENSVIENPIKKNGKVSICNIELLLEEDIEVPDSKLHLYNIEEEYIGFGGGFCFSEEIRGCSSRLHSLATANYSSTRLCYTTLWKKLPQNIPVRELAISRNHIAVLLNNGHVYVTLSELNDTNNVNSSCNFSDLRKRTSINSSLNDNLNDTNEQRNSINSSNTLLLENSVSNNNWLHVRELDDKNIRGIKISSYISSYNSFEYKHDNKSFVLGSLNKDGKVWVVEYNSVLQNTNLKYLDVGVLDNVDSEFDNQINVTRAIDITFSEVRPLTDNEISSFANNYDEINRFPYFYGMAITCLLEDNESNCIILRSNLGIGEHDSLLMLNKPIILDLPNICRKIFCGVNMEYGLILLQNGTLWSWELNNDVTQKDHFPNVLRLSNLKQTNKDFSQNDISFRSLGKNSLNYSIQIKKIQGSLKNKKVVDFSGINGEFIALTCDGVISEWNNRKRKTLFTRPLIEDPVIFTPKSHYEIVKNFRNNDQFILTEDFQICHNRSQSDYTVDMSTPDHSQSEKEGVSINQVESRIDAIIKSEIDEIYDSNNKIIGVWLLEGITLVLHEDSTLKAIYNYIGRDGYNTKTGLVSEDDKVNGDKQISSIINCIQWSYRLGKCIPANPIALVGLLSSFSECNSLSEKAKQLSIQRSLVKLSLREMPVYRILACYNTVVFGILRSNPKWRSNKNTHSGSSKCRTSSNEKAVLNKIQNHTDVYSKNVVGIDKLKDDGKQINGDGSIISQTKNLHKKRPLKLRKYKNSKQPRKINKQIVIELENEFDEKAELQKQLECDDPQKEISNCNLVSIEQGQNFNVVDTETLPKEMKENKLIEEKDMSDKFNENTDLNNNECNIVHVPSIPVVDSTNVHPISPLDNSSLIALSQSYSTKQTFSDRGKQNNNYSCNFPQLSVVQIENKEAHLVPTPHTKKRSSNVKRNQGGNNKSSGYKKKRERSSLSGTLNEENVDPNIDALDIDSKDRKEKYLKYYNNAKKEDNSPLWEPKKINLIEYEVEQILSIREKPLSRQKEYLIKWKVPGHPVQPTWEPEENLNGCEELLQEFLKSIKTSRSGRLLLPCTHTH